MKKYTQRKMEDGEWKMAKPSVRGVLAIFYLLSSTLCFSTQVLFPLSQMFGMTNYARQFKIQATSPLTTDNTRLFVGTYTLVTPVAGSDPVVTLTPNNYLVTFSDATTPWRISVPATNIVLNALNLTPTNAVLPTFNYQAPYPALVAGSGISLSTVSNATTISATGGGPALTNGVPWFGPAIICAGIGENPACATSGVYISAGIAEVSPTASLNTFPPAPTIPNPPFATLAAPYLMQAISNGAPAFYLLSCGEQNTSGQNDTALYTSFDLAAWSRLGSINVGANYTSQSSGRVFQDATNGFHLVLGLSTNGLQPAFICDLASDNLLQWSNLRQLAGVTNDLNNSSPGGACIIFTNGLYYAFATADSTFSGDGSYYTNNSLSSWPWVKAGQTGCAGSGPNVFFYGGLWHAIYTCGSRMSSSSNLVNWSAPVACLNNLPAPEGSYLVTTNPASVVPSLFAGVVMGSKVADTGGATLFNGVVSDAWGDTLNNGTISDASGDYMSGGVVSDAAGDTLSGGNLTLAGGGQGIPDAYLQQPPLTNYAQISGSVNFSIGAYLGNAGSVPNAALVVPAVTNNQPAFIASNIFSAPGGHFTGNGSGLTNLVALAFTNSPPGLLTNGLYKVMPAAGFVTVGVLLTNTQIAWLTNQTSHYALLLGSTTGTSANYHNGQLLVNSGDSVCVTNMAGAGGGQLITSYFQAYH
jgi:hypothetical protein